MLAAAFVAAPAASAHPGGLEGTADDDFKCWVVINSPYRQLCMTIHTLRNGRIHVSRSVLAQEANNGDSG